MKVVLASTAGFCIGVKRALEMVLKAINENQTKIYTYGPLIHNPQVLELLRERGITILTPGENVPTGLVVSCQDEKSQLQNKEQAFRILRARLYDIAQAEQNAQVAAQRRSQVGTGDRAQKIRTYNFPQGRVTDHRVGLTSHRLEAILQGELEEFTEALRAQDRAEQLAAATF